MKSVAYGISARKIDRLVQRARVDLLALRGQRVRDVPVLHGILAAQAVRDVGVAADAVALRHVRAQHRQAVAHLRAEDDAGQPCRLGLEDRVELVHPGLREALRRHPHLRLRVELAQAGGLPLEQRHQVLRLRVPGIAARDEDRVDARQLREDFRPFLERELDLLRIAVVLVQRRVPDPDVLPVLVGDARHLHHHVDLRQREVRAVRPHRRSAAGSARSRWCRRWRDRGCTAPTSARPTRRRRSSSAGSRADGRGARPAESDTIDESRRARRTSRASCAARAAAVRRRTARRAHRRRARGPSARAAGGVDARRGSLRGPERRRCGRPRRPAPAHVEEVASGPTAITGTLSRRPLVSRPAAERSCASRSPRPGRARRCAPGTASVGRRDDRGAGRGRRGRIGAGVRRSCLLLGEVAGRRRDERIAE